MVNRPLAVVPRGLFPAAQALSRVGVALVSVAVTRAGPTVGEAPVTRQAAVTLSAVSSGDALALTNGLVAEGVE